MAHVGTNVESAKSNDPGIIGIHEQEREREGKKFIKWRMTLPILVFSFLTEYSMNSLDLYYPRKTKTFLFFFFFHSSFIKEINKEAIIIYI